MEFKNKTKNRVNDDGQQKQGLKTMFKEAVKKAEEDQMFSNSRLRIFEVIPLSKDVQTAIVDLHISKHILTYEVTFDLFYTKSDGKVMVTKCFHTVNLTRQGSIPAYLIDEVTKFGKADVRFDSVDIDILYNERSVKVNEEISYSELLEECKNEGITNLVLIDRVFYTRIECYRNGAFEDAIHVALIKEFPDCVSVTLYPCKSVELLVR